MPCAGTTFASVSELHNNIEGAKAKAREIARELAREPETYCGYRVIVTNESGMMIASIPIATDE